MTEDTTAPTTPDAATPDAAAPAASQGRSATRALTRIGLGIVALVQVAFAFLAFWDLAHRPQRDVRGPKVAWIPAILVNWIGPASYFLFGIRR